ncbi:MAG: YfhO family protein [Candidatus Hydrogenedentes bacterium]|nr:YfhO family protein [Candidatus Hydrogenedentota bacterium]
MYKRIISILCVVFAYCICIAIVYAAPVLETGLFGLTGLGDTWYIYGPYAFFLDNRMRDGEFPLWNPLTLCGMPFAANPQALAFYPPNLARSVLTFDRTPYGTHITLAFMMATHVLNLACSTFWLARLQRISHGASFVAGLASITAMCVTQTTIANPIHVLIFSWTPLVLSLITKAISTTSEKRVAWTVAAGLVYGLQVLAGFPQLLLYVTLVYGVYAVAMAFSDHTTIETKQMPLKRLMANITVIAMLGIIGVLIAAVALIPAYELGRLSSRWAGQHQQFAGSQGTWDISVWDIFTNWSDATPGADAAERLQKLGEILSLPLRGQLLFLIALPLVILSSNRRAKWVFVILAYCALDLSYGPPWPLASVAKMLAPFPLSTSAIAFILLSLPVALLAALGIDTLRDNNPAAKRGIMPQLLTASLCALLCAIALATMVPLGNADIPFTALTAMALAAFFLPASRARMRFRTAACSLVLAALTLGNAAMRGYDDPDGQTLLFPLTSNFEGTRHTITHFSPLSRYCLPLQPDLNTHAPRSIQDHSFPVNARMYTLQPSVYGYDSIQLSHVVPVLTGITGQYNRLVTGPVLSKNAYVPLLLTEPLWLARNVVRDELPADHSIFPPTYVAFVPLYDRQGPVPELPREEVPRSALAQPRLLRIWNAPAPETSGEHIHYALGNVDTTPQRTALRLIYSSASSATFNITIDDGPQQDDVVLGPISLAASPSNTTTIEWPFPILTPAQLRIDVSSNHPSDFVVHTVELLEDEGDERHLVRFKKFTANRVEIETGELPGPRMLVYTDASFPGWSAQIDGAPTTLYRANGGFKAVAVPPGNHTITFLFKSNAIQIGLTCSLLTLLTCVIVLFALCWRFRHQRTLRGS